MAFSAVRGGVGWRKAASHFRPYPRGCRDGVIATVDGSFAPSQSTGCEARNRARDGPPVAPGRGTSPARRVGRVGRHLEWSCGMSYMALAIGDHHRTHAAHEMWRK
eukprot:2863467-Pyramimonas_sp.AAC.1